MMENFLVELSQFGFIGSISFIVYMIAYFFIMLIGRVRLGKDTKFKATALEKTLLWFSLVYILTYLI